MDATLHLHPATKQPMAYKTRPDESSIDLQKYAPVLDYVSEWALNRTWNSETEELRSLYEEWKSTCAAVKRDPGTSRAFSERIMRCANPKLIPFRGPGGRINYRIYKLRKA